MIKDPNLTKQFAHIIRSLVKLVEEGYSQKQHLQFLHGKDMICLLSGAIGHFARVPTLIFRTLVTYAKILK